MFITYTDKNKYGGYTHEIEFSSILVIRLTEMDSNTIQIEFLEKRIFFRDKVFFTNISHGSLIDSVSKAFAIILYPSAPFPFEVDLSAMKDFKENVLNFMVAHKNNIIQESIVKF